MSQLQLDPSLKLTHCPSCDYSLQGLPETGICPECGRAYNHDFIILRGSAIRYRRIILELIGIVVTGLVMTQRLPTVMFLTLGLFIIITGLRIGLVIFGSVQRSHHQVWLSAAGIGRQAVANVSSLGGRVLVLAGAFEIASIPVVGLTLYLGLIASVFRQTAAFMNGLDIALVLLFLFGGAIVWLKRRPPIALRADEVRPALVPWRFFGSVELEDLGNGRHQLWARLSPHIRPKDVVLVAFHASPEGIRQLHELLVQWAEPEIAVKLKPFRGSRKLKRFV